GPYEPVALLPRRLAPAACLRADSGAVSVLYPAHRAGVRRAGPFHHPARPENGAGEAGASAGVSAALRPRCRAPGRTGGGRVTRASDDEPAFIRAMESAMWNSCGDVAALDGLWRA